MLFFSTLLKSNSQYSLSAENLFCVLSDSGEEFTLFDGAKDIWARDYMTPTYRISLTMIMTGVIRSRRCSFFVGLMTYKIA